MRDWARGTYIACTAKGLQVNVEQELFRAGMDCPLLHSKGRILGLPTGDKGWTRATVLISFRLSQALPKGAIGTACHTNDWGPSGTGPRTINPSLDTPGHQYILTVVCSKWWTVRTASRLESRSAPSGVVTRSRRARKGGGGSPWGSVAVQGGLSGRQRLHLDFIRAIQPRLPRVPSSINPHAPRDGYA